MAPSKKRSVLERKADHAHRVSGKCACLEKPRSDGLCTLNVWQGTMIDTKAAQSGERLLRPHLPVVKYKEWTFFGLSGHLYHLVILGWVQLLCLFVAVYIFVVGFFALLYGACNGIDYPNRHAEVRYYFNLSLQTLATIGYGYLFPNDSCSNWVSVVESFASILLMSFMTGVAFVKFARPKPNIIFSKVFTVAERENGGLEMRFRVVNGTRREIISRGEILEVSFKLILMRVEGTKFGEKKLCYYDLPLKTNSFIALRLEAELVHHIDDGSPFFGLKQEDIQSSDFILILMMAGVDQNLHDMIHKQHEYDHESMRWAAKFVPMMDWNPKYECLDLDFDKVSTIIPQPFQKAMHSGIDIEGSPQSSVESGEVHGDESETGNVEGSYHEIDLNELQFKTALSLSQEATFSRPKKTEGDLTTSLENLDPQSFSDLGEDRTSGENEDEEEETKSETSTKTNSDLEEIEKHSTPPQHHIRFDRRSRSTNIRIPHLSRHTHSHDTPTEPSFDQPASVTRRRVRFRNHPMSRFSKGLYYRALETSWSRLLVWLVVVYFAVISIIAFLLYITPGQFVLQTADIHAVTGYERLFFFCAQTISTIGYGSLSPNPDSDLVNFFVFVLVFAGAIVSTLLTGLAWAKFSIPKASTVLFSDNMLLTAFHGSRALVFRAANNRTFGMIIEGSFRVSVVILNRRLERRETHELKLIRNVWPIVQLGTTVTHIIDEASPLYDFSVDELLSGHHFFVVLFSGLDSVIGENMFSRKTYHSCDVLVGHDFVDNIKLATDGLHIDLEAINDTHFAPDVELRESRLFTPLAEEDPSHLSEYEDFRNGNLNRDRNGDDDSPLQVDSPTANYVQMEE